MRANRRILAGSGLLVLATLGAWALETNRDPVRLQIEWRPGKTYLQKFEMDQSSTLSVNGQSVDQKTSMAMDLEMKVSTLPDSANKKVDTRYTHISMNMTMMGMNMGFDSSKPEASAGPLAELGRFVGQGFTVIVDPNNTIVEVTGLEELTKTAGASPMAAEATATFFGEKQLSQMMNHWVTKGFPNKAVKPRDTWPIHETMEFPGLGSMTIQGTSTFAGYEEYAGHDCAVIDIVSEISSEPQGGTSDGGAAEPMAMRIVGGKATSRVYWDPRLNWMRRLEMTQTMSLSMKNPADGSEMTIPTKQTVKMTVEVD